ncbi:hypothetical protein BKA70DRAFT_1503094 [Coprinopsis sp. MPI-PUGE-AT-0042]|nr:hypothetical protein BKA70DRAFT_1503094 [Coprinopsis sp. MPI-PUGE-AT-0042]
MVYWSSDVNDLIAFFRERPYRDLGGPLRLYEGPDADVMIEQDIFALAICASFSAIQTQIIYRLYRHMRGNKLSERSSRFRLVFRAVSIVLGLGFTLCTVILVTNTVIKLEYIAKLVKADGSHGTRAVCPAGCTIYPFGLFCVEDKRVYLLRVISILDVVTAALFQLLIVLADGLLVYRCYLVLENPWSWIIVVPTVITLLGSLFFLVMQIGSTDPIPKACGMYTSLFVNFIVSPTLIVWIWRAKREVNSLLEHPDRPQTQMPYNRLIRILTESALPPLLLGFTHLGLFLSKGSFPVLNVLWVIFTVMRRFVCFLCLITTSLDPRTSNYRSSGRSRKTLSTRESDDITNAKHANCVQVNSKKHIV